MIELGLTPRPGLTVGQLGSPAVTSAALQIVPLELNVADFAGS